jgi:hypothetical protein
MGFVEYDDGGSAAFSGFGGQRVAGLGDEGGGVEGGLAAQGGDDVVVDAAVILSFRVSQGCDLRCLVLDGV